MAGLGHDQQSRHLICIGFVAFHKLERGEGQPVDRFRFGGHGRDARDHHLDRQRRGVVVSGPLKAANHVADVEVAIPGGGFRDDDLIGPWLGQFPCAQLQIVQRNQVPHVFLGNCIGPDVLIARRRGAHCQWRKQYRGHHALDGLVGSDLGDHARIDCLALGRKEDAHPAQILVDGVKGIAYGRNLKNKQRYDHDHQRHGRDRHHSPALVPPVKGPGRQGPG